MVSPWVENGGDGLQIWRVAASRLNEQLWTGSNGWSSSLGVELGLATFYFKNTNLL